MTQEDKELLLRDLCARLPYRLCVRDEYGEIDYINYNDVHFANYFDSILNGKVKPYLRPMSSMTEEEAKELSILCDITDVLSIKITDKYIDFEVDDGFSSIETKIIWFNDIISSIEIFDWLNKNHFDYRNLIQMKLAIAVTKENNPYKE